MFNWRYTFGTALSNRLGRYSLLITARAPVKVNHLAFLYSFDKDLLLKQRLLIIYIASLHYGLLP